MSSYCRLRQNQKVITDMLTPKLMRMSVLTAAIQNVVPKPLFREDPIAAAMQSTFAWIEIARRLGIGLQLSAALPEPDSYLPAEALLDPVAAHLAVRSPRSGSGDLLSNSNAQKIIEACGNDVAIYDLGAFENLLAPDDAIRGQVYDHMLRVADAAVKLRPVGCTGISGFIGANPNVDMDQNMEWVALYFIPLLQELDKLGLFFYVENCPMPGWNTTERFLNNMAYTPGMWIALRRLADRHGVGHVLKLNYDASHDILLGTTPQASFAVMKAAGLAGMVDRFHGKDMLRNLAKSSVWSIFGQRVGLGCRENGQPHPEPAKQGAAWGRMTGDHAFPGVSTYDPAAQLAGTRVDWFAHQYYARETLGLNPETTVFHLEHEWGPARTQNVEMVTGMIALGVQFMSAIDAAADAKFRAREWCAANGLPLPGAEWAAMCIPGLDQEVAGIK